MKGNKKKLLFISHDSSLTGAPILLLNLIKLFKTETSHDITVCVKRGGNLDQSFQSFAKTIILKPKNYHFNKAFYKKIAAYLKYRVQLLRLIQLSRKADIIISNTITNGRLLTIIPNKKIIVYVHELEGAIKLSNKFGDVDLSVKHADAFFSPTPAVTNNLSRNHNVKEHLIFPLHYYFPPLQVNLTELDSKKQAFFREHKIPAAKFYVVGSGTANFRKGIDFFIETSKILLGLDADVFFVWIGGFTEAEFKEKMHTKIENERITNLLITGFIPPSADNLAPFDILALTSREDPYPLVVLEAAQLKIPAISFLGTGGIDDFLKDDSGFLLTDRTPTNLANQILIVKNNKHLLKQYGENAYRKVQKLHSDPSAIINQFEVAIKHIENSKNV